MYKHLFGYHLKMSLRIKELIFWSLLFPILLGILFHFAFSNMMSGEAFEIIPVAVVLDESEEAASFQTVLDALSVPESKKDSTDDSKLFHVTYATQDKADQLLENGDVTGIITYNEELTYLAAESKSYAETVTKAFLDRYQQNVKTVTLLMTNTQGQVNPEQIIKSLSAKTLIEEYSVSHAKPDTTVNYFYTLIAMACFFAATDGVQIIQTLQANASPLAARQNAAPTSKLLMFLSKATAGLVLQYAMKLVVLAFLIYILKVDFGNRILLVLFTTLVGVLSGILLGTICALVVPGSEMTKDGVASGIIMFGCFLSGMMSSDIKYLISVNFPVLAKINPVNLLTDSYYALYFYDDTAHYWGNMAGLGIICAILLAVTLFFVRRLKYDAL